MIFLIIIIAAIAAWAYFGNHDTAATKEALKLKERNDEQKKVIILLTSFRRLSYSFVR